MKVIIYEKGFEEWLASIPLAEWEGVTGSPPRPPFGEPIQGGWGPTGLCIAAESSGLPSYQIPKRWEGEVFDIIPPRLAKLLEKREDTGRAQQDVTTLAARLVGLLPEESGLRQWISCYEEDTEIDVDCAVSNLREALYGLDVASLDESLE